MYLLYIARARYCFDVLISRSTSTMVRATGFRRARPLARRAFSGRPSFICVTNLRHAFPPSACLSRGLPVPSPVSTCASRRTRSTPSSTRCASLMLGAPGRDGEESDVSFRERGRKPSSSITPVAPGTKRSRSGRCDSSSPRRTRTRTAVWRHASTRTPRRHPRGSCSSGRVRESETGVTGI